jgi:hypothetical protein
VFYFLFYEELLPSELEIYILAAFGVLRFLLRRARDYFEMDRRLAGIFLGCNEQQQEGA